MNQALLTGVLGATAITATGPTRAQPAQTGVRSGFPPGGPGDQVKPACAR